MVQCNFRIASGENNKDWLQKNVFHTKYTAYDKVCLVIIDNGNFKNMISMKMVQTLNLKLVPHPNPYKLCWLQKGSEIKVKMRCLVKFSIRNY